MSLDIVSAIILTHNRLELLKRSIDSVFAQTYPDIECIVVDNGSTDGTREYCLSRKGVNYIYSNPPKEAGNGCNYSRNLGIKACTGSLIALLDDDDYWLPTKIEKQVALMKEKGCGIVYCGTTAEIIEAGTTYQEWPVNHDKEGDMSVKCLIKPFVLTSQLLIKKELIENAGLFDENVQFWQETELVIRLCQLSPIWAVDECLMVYRIEKTDKEQQGNRFNGWRESVRYIYNIKHKVLYQRLSLPEKVQANRYIIENAYDRAMKTRSDLWAVLYRTQISLLNTPHNIKKIIKTLNTLFHTFLTCIRIES